MHINACLNTGLSHPILQDEGPQLPLAPRGGPRRDRHPGGSGAQNLARTEYNPARLRPVEVRRRGMEVER